MTKKFFTSKIEEVKQMKEIKINDKRNRNIAIAIIVSLLAVAWGVFIMSHIITQQLSKKIVTTSVPEETNSNAPEEIEWFTTEDGKEINISEVMEKNVGAAKKEQLETKIVELEYETEYQKNSQLPKGMVKILQQGQDGEQELIIRKQFEGDKLVSDEQVGRKITKACINKIVQVGTSEYYDKHTIKKGETVYSTPYTLALRENPKKDAEVIISIDQDSRLKVVEKKDSWYYVQYNSSYYGWVEDDCVTYINPKQTNYNNGRTKYSKQQLLAKLNKNMNVMQPSGLTLEQFKKILSNNKSDKNKVFAKNAEYFYYAEKQYGVNGVFLAAIAVHESAWGTSRIARDKKNLFGYGAYDMSAYSSAYSYNGYAAGIDMVARVLVKNYLNPKGTAIYNGEVASGRFYHGRTIKSVNTKYATDKNWHNSVYSWMSYLYHRL